MNKLIEQNQSKKSRFLKYSLLASISVGAIIAAPFEGMAMSTDQQALFRTELSKKLSLRLSQSNENKDTINTPQQIGTVIVPGPEINTYTPSEIREMEIANQHKDKASNPLKDIPIEDHYKVVARSKSDVGSKRKVRPPTRRKTLVGNETTEQSQNNSSLEPTEQTPKKPEIETSSPASSGSDSFVTASSNTPNTTPPFLTPPTSPTYTNVPSPTPTQYELTPESKPNDGVGANNTSPKQQAARRKLSFSGSQQIVQLSKPVVPPKPITFVLLPTKKSSAEVAAKMVSNILLVNETIGNELAKVTLAIKDTKGKKNKAPLQKLHKQLISSQKTTEALKLEAEKIAEQIKTLSDKNGELKDLSKGIRVKSVAEQNADKLKIGENIEKIKKLEKDLESKKNEADKLSQKIDISVNKVVLTKPQEKAPVTEIPTARPFLNQQQQLDMLTQREKVKAARQDILNKNKEAATTVKRNSAENEEFINKRDQEGLAQHQQNIATEKQLKKERPKQQKAEGIRLEKKKTEEKAEEIVTIRSDIAKKMQQISETNTTSNKLHELQLKVKTIEDKQQKQAAQKQLSELKKQEEAIKKAAGKAQKIADSAKTETSRTKLQKQQIKINGYYKTVTNSNIEASIKNLEILVPTPPASPSPSTIPPKQPLKAELTMPLSHEVRRILDKQPEEGDGYLVPIKVQPQTYITLSQNQEVANTIAQPISQNLKPQTPFQSSYPKDIYEAKVSQYINILRNTQPNKSNQDQINVAMDSLVTEMEKLNEVQFSQKLDEIVNIPKAIYDNLLPRLYAAQQVKLQKTKAVYEAFQSYNDNQRLKKASLQNASNILMQGATDLGLLQQELHKKAQNLLKIRNAMPQTHHTKIPDESLGSGKNWKNPASHSSNSEVDTKQAEYLDLATNISTQKPKQSDILEALDLITPKQKTTVAKSDSSRKSNVSGSIPEIQQPQSKQNTDLELQRRLDYLDLATNMSTQKPKQSDILEALDLTPKQKTTAAKSDSSRKSNVSGSIPEIQQPQSKQNTDLELKKRLDYLDLGSSTFDLSKLDTEDQLQKVKNAKGFTEEQYFAVFNKNPSDQERLERLALEALDLSKMQTQLERNATKTTASQPKIVQPVLKNTNKRLKSPRTLKQIEAKHAMEEFLNEARLTSFSELWRKNNDDPLLTDLGNQIFKGKQEIQKLEEDINILKNETIQSDSLSRTSSASSLNDLSSSNVTNLEKLKYAHEGIANDYKAKELELDVLDPEDSKFKELMLEVFKMSKDKIWLEEEIKQHSTENKPVFSRSPSVDSINSVSSDDYTNYSTILVENKIALLQTYQMAVIAKIQELEKLPSTSSGIDQNAQQIAELKKAAAAVRDDINAYKADPSKLNNVSLEEINKNLKQLGVELSESVISALESKAQKDPEDYLASDDESKSALPERDEEQEDTEVKDTSKELSSLPAPASSNEYALALSDSSEKECLALSDGSEDEEDDEGYNSGSEEEEETIGKLSDSEDDNFEATKIDAAILLKQEEKEEATKSIAAIAPTLNQGSKIVKSIGNLITSTRLDTAVAAGDEEEVHIKRGLWVRGMYGINNHGRVENINGYRGTNKGATIGFDVEIDNNIVGIAYSNVHSVFKFKNSKNNDKEIIDSHVVSIYGQKELPKDFALQALVSASKNFIKDKTTYSYGDTKIRSNVKHRNHSYNAEALLNYNYLVKNNLVITPNIGLRYGKSRDGVYNETGINVQEIALTMKENNILSGIVGTKVKVPLKDALKFNNLGLTFQGAVEHNFKEKTQRINRVVKIFDTEFKQNYAIPKQPKTSYNLGTGIMGSIKNTTISLDYNYYLNKHYRSHQGSVKLKVNL